MPAGHATPWSRWQGTDPPPIGYAATLGTTSPWRPHAAGFSARDLGLDAASRGTLGLRHLRVSVPGGGSGDGGWNGGELDFVLQFVLRGSIHLELPGGELDLGPGDAWITGRGAPCRQRPSPDCELIELSAPARPSGETVRTPGTRTVAARPDAPSAWTRGSGPRPFFAYRDLATHDATGGRIGVGLVRAIGDAPEGGTGWHYHTMAQAFVVLDGISEIAVEGRGRATMRRGDAMCIPRGCRHNLETFSPEHTILQLAIPGDYETIASDPPPDSGGAA